MKNWDTISLEDHLQKLSINNLHLKYSIDKITGGPPECLPVCLFMLGDVGRYAFLDHEMRNFFSAQFDPTKDLQNLEGKVIIVTGGK
jgi:hypothetical protein